MVCVDPSKRSVIEGHQVLSKIHELHVPDNTYWHSSEPRYQQGRAGVLCLPVSCGSGPGGQKLHSVTPERLDGSAGVQ